MNKILRKAPILFLISISLIGCTSEEDKVLKRLEKNFHLKHIVGSKLLFVYEDFKGFDNAGPAYYVVDLANTEEEFNRQFESSKPELVPWRYTNQKDAEFETRVNDFIQQWMANAYLSFDEEYKIDFNRRYAFFHQTSEPFERAFISYEGSSIYYFLYYQQ